MRARSRSVYLPLLRGITPRPLEAFDPVDQTLVTGQRAGHHGSRPGALPAELAVRPTAGAGAGRAAARPDRRRTKTASGRFTVWCWDVRRRQTRSSGAGRSWPSTRRPRPSWTPRPAPSRRSRSPPSRRRRAKPKPQPDNPDEVDQTGEPIVEPVVRAKRRPHRSLARVRAGALRHGRVPLRQVTCPRDHAD